MCNLEQLDEAARTTLAAPLVVFANPPRGRSAMASSSSVKRHTVEQSQSATPDESSTAPAWQRKDIFVAALAHELRQPLSAMLAAMAVARLAPGTDVARRADEVVQRQVTQMSRLVEDLVQ